MQRSKVVALTAALAMFTGLAIWGSPASGSTVIPEADVIVKVIPSYAQDIQPMFDNSCSQCHGPAEPAAGVDLSSYEGVLRGSTNGPMVIPGQPELSNLVTHLNKEIDPQLWGVCLSPGNSPSSNQIKNLERWIEAGARNN